MIDVFSAVVAGGAGTLLGAFYFGTLWWTVRKGVASTRPALWFFGSFVLRTSVTLLGFYLVGRGHWLRTLVCLLGFIVARLLVTWLTRPAKIPAVQSQQEARHAS